MDDDQKSHVLPPEGKGNTPVRRLEVQSTEMVTPRMRRVIFAVEGMDALVYQPGQAMTFLMTLPDGGEGRRDYTIRGVDRTAGTMSVDFFLHGDTPGASWARCAQPGDVIAARGPRGKVTLGQGADWYLMVGDETAIPAILHMIEALPDTVPVTAFIEIGCDSDRQSLPGRANLHIHWIARKGHPAPAESELAVRVAGFSLPEGDGRACVIGETSKVQTVRRQLIARGMDKTAIAAEGYWRPGRVGGHDHIRD